MGKEHFFAEPGFGDRGDDFGRDAGKFGIAAVIGAMEDEGNKRRARRDDLVTELTREVVTERGSAHPGNREATGGDDENRRAKFLGIGAQHEFGGTNHFRDASVEEYLHVRGAALEFEKVGDLRGGIVAEELAERFFVVGNVMFFNESDEIFRSEARQGRFREMRIGGEEIFGRGIEVGKIAASATRNEDFLADAVGVFEDGDAAAAFDGFDGTEKAGGAGTEDEHVKGARHSVGSLGEKRGEYKKNRERKKRRALQRV